MNLRQQHRNVWRMASAQNRYFICFKLTTRVGRSHAVSKASMLPANTDIVRSDLGIADIEYLVSISAHPLSKFHFYFFLLFTIFIACNRQSPENKNVLVFGRLPQKMNTKTSVAQSSQSGNQLPPHWESLRLFMQIKI